MERRKGGSIKSVAPHKLLRRREAGVVLMLEEVWACTMCPLSPFHSHNHKIAQILQCSTLAPLEGQKRGNDKCYGKINMYCRIMRNRTYVYISVNESLIMTQSQALCLCSASVTSTVTLQSPKHIELFFISSKSRVGGDLY